MLKIKLMEFNEKPFAKTPPKKIPLDEHGQPLANINEKRVFDRTTAELIGMAKGMLADGKLCSQEADFLTIWLQENQEYSDKWPVNVVKDRVATMLNDGIIDENERAELFLLLKQLVGNELIAPDAPSFATSLPLTKPAPKIVFQDKVFCFTGKFCSGTRADCENTTVVLGGRHIKSITQSLDYLIVGLMGSRDWIQSTHGRKIEKAVEYGVNILSEEEWNKAITKLDLT